jgi:hypothetical protein
VARFAGGVEGHKFEANAVWIVQVELVLAVEADFGSSAQVVLPRPGYYYLNWF